MHVTQHDIVCYTVWYTSIKMITLAYCSRPSCSAIPPGITLVTYMAVLLITCGLSVPPAILKPSPVVPYIIPTRKRTKNQLTH